MDLTVAEGGSQSNEQIRVVDERVGVCMRDRVSTFEFGGGVGDTAA